MKTEYEKLGHDFAKGIIGYLGPRCLVFLAIMGIFYVLFGFMSIGVDDSDKDGWTRSGLRIRTDYKTGLQYLETQKGFITPRLDKDGKQFKDI